MRDVLARGLQDPRIAGLVTVVGVTVSDDLAEAVVRVSVLPESRETLTLHGLQAAAAHVRREVGDRVRLRRVPRLTFRLDRASKKEAEVLRALARVREEDSARGPGERGGGATEEGS